MKRGNFSPAVKPALKQKAERKRAISVLEYSKLNIDETSTQPQAESIHLSKTNLF